MAWLNIAEWLECTEVEGPGRRFALWVQGCNIRCPECCNQHMFSFAPRHIVAANEVLTWIEAAHRRYQLEGVTFLGGEPLLQAKGLAVVAHGCQQMGLSVMVFTGFTLDQIKRCPLPGVNELLQVTDVLVDGPYIASQPDTQRNWVGSENQRFHFFTDRYRPGIEYDPSYQRGCEVRVKANGTIRWNGWPIERSFI